MHLEWSQDTNITSSFALLPLKMHLHFKYLDHSSVLMVSTEARAWWLIWSCIDSPSPLQQWLTISSADCSESGITAKLSLNGLSIQFILNSSCWRPSWDSVLDINFLNIAWIKYDMLNVYPQHSCSLRQMFEIELDWWRLTKPPLWQTESLQGKKSHFIS